MMSDPMNTCRLHLLVLLLALNSAVAVSDEPSSGESTSGESTSGESTSGESAAPAVSEETLRSVQEAKTLFAAALSAKGGQRLEGLRESYRKLSEAAKSESGVPPARTMWAKMLLSVGDKKSAAAALQQAVIERPDDPEAFLILANQSVATSRLAEAELAYRQASELINKMPDDDRRKRGLAAQAAAGLASVAGARSRLAQRNEMPELAAGLKKSQLNHLRRWVAVAPDSASAHDRLAVALLQQDDVDGAVQEFERARELNPDLPLTDLRLAQAFVAAGRREQAMDRLWSAASADGNDVKVRVSVADLYLVLGDLLSAEANIDAALRLNPESLEANRLRAQWLRFKGRWDEAAESLQALNNQHPTDFETANLLALTLAEADDDEARRRALSVATVTAQRFAADSPQGRRARVTLSWAAYRAGETEVSKRTLNGLLNTGIESNRISGDEGFMLARLLSEFGRPELASPLLASVLSRVGSFPKRKEAESLLSQLQ